MAHNLPDALRVFWQRYRESQGWAYWQVSSRIRELFQHGERGECGGR